MTPPVRLQLSRKARFNLQAASRAINGLEAVSVARPGRWGNPFVVNTNRAPGAKLNARHWAAPTVEEAVALFRAMMEAEGEHVDLLRARLPELRGKNLACWCAHGSDCHADVLLELANP